MVSRRRQKKRAKRRSARLRVKPDTVEKALGAPVDLVPEKLPDDPLILPEVILSKFGEEIPDPVQQTDLGAFYAALIGTRAAGLYENFLHSLASPTNIGRLIALRPLVEAAIILKWISLDPDNHGTLWFGQSEAQDLKAIREQEKHLGVQVRGDVPSETVEEAVVRKQAIVDTAKARASAMERNYGRRVMPELARMVDEIAEQDPGHEIAMRQAYDAAYRAFSPWTHTEATSFKATAEESSEGLLFVGDRSPFKQYHLRIIAGAMFAYVLEILGLSTQSGNEVPARFIRDYLTLYVPIEPND